MFSVGVLRAGIGKDLGEECVEHVSFGLWVRFIVWPDFRSDVPGLSFFLLLI